MMSMKDETRHYIYDVNKREEELLEEIEELASFCKVFNSIADTMLSDVDEYGSVDWNNPIIDDLNSACDKYQKYIKGRY